MQVPTLKQESLKSIESHPDIDEIFYRLYTTASVAKPLLMGHFFDHHDLNEKSKNDHFLAFKAGFHYHSTQPTPYQIQGVDFKQTKPNQSTFQFFTRPKIKLNHLLRSPPNNLRLKTHMQ